MTVAVRTGLPGRAYASRERYEHEAETLLPGGWLCLGRADEVAAPGDFITMEVLGEPLLVVRGEDGAVRVFANICRHRASPVASGSGNAKRFVCPYHAWSYARDGALVSAPRMAKECLEGLRLHEHRSETWRGFLYVNLDGRADPLAPQLAALDARVAPYAPDAFRTFHVGEKVWRANWKALVENFLEAYHLSVVHMATLHEYTPTALARKFDGGAVFTGYYANYPDSAASRGDGAPGLSQDERRRSTLFAVYPCHLVSQAASLLASFSLIPEGPHATRVRWSLSSYGDDLDDETKALRTALWAQVNEEDRARLEATQAGIGSRFADAGPLAPEHLEGVIADFHDYLGGAAITFEGAGR